MNNNCNDVFIELKLSIAFLASRESSSFVLCSPILVGQLLFTIEKTYACLGSVNQTVWSLTKRMNSESELLREVNVKFKSVMFRHGTSTGSRVNCVRSVSLAQTNTLACWVTRRVNSNPMSMQFGRDQSTESLGPMRISPIDRNAINPVYVAWSAGGKRPSANMAGGSQPANRDPTYNWVLASDWCPRYLSPALDDIQRDRYLNTDNNHHTDREKKKLYRSS